ncbi:hypothetical protein V6N11_018941 [Hibiscus sabdariffa]|uniref:Uncharacterized protein n=1 Tax=Hibiscus sabdariffa TaxID=183260 RepID=A0ABR2R159_9ROSI
MIRKREWEENRLLGEAELAGCLPDEVVNSVVPLHTIEEIQAKVMVQNDRTNNILGLSGKSLDSQILEDMCSKRVEKLGFPPNDFFQPEFQDGRDLGSNSSWEVVVPGLKNIKDSWAKAVETKSMKIYRLILMAV